MFMLNEEIARFSVASDTFTNNAESILIRLGSTVRSRFEIFYDEFIVGGGSSEDCMSIANGDLVMKCDAIFETNVNITGDAKIIGGFSAGQSPSREGYYALQVSTEEKEGVSGVVVNSGFSAGTDPTRKHSAFQVYGCYPDFCKGDVRQGGSGVVVNSGLSAGQSPSREGYYALQVSTEQKEGGGGVVVNSGFSAGNDPTRKHSAFQVYGCYPDFCKGDVRQKQGGGGVNVNAPMDIDGQDLVIKRGNLIIHNGEEGTTIENAPTDKPGTGNIIIGQNLDQHDRHYDRHGSHNLIIGDYHTYSHNGGIVVGTTNSIENTNAIVLGGHSSTASGFESVIIGGQCSVNPYSYYTTTGGYCPKKHPKSKKVTKKALIDQFIVYACFII